MEKKAHQTLNEIQAKLSVPKKHYNSYSDFYYRKVDDIMDSLKPLLGTAIIKCSDEIVLIGERYYVKATASIVEDDGSIVFVLGYAREIEKKTKMDESQLTGMASTYARKYALNGLLGLDDTHDPDTNSGEKEKKPASEPKSQDPFIFLENATGMSVEDIKIRLKKAGLTTLKQVKAMGNKACIAIIEGVKTDEQL